MSNWKFVVPLIAMFSLSAYAADNSIYIEQTGDNAIITMEQDGAGNRIRGIQGVGTGNTTPARIKGDAIQLDVKQIGSGNIFNFGMATATANGSTPTNITYMTTGNNSTATLNLNNDETNSNASTILDINQTGDGSNVNLNILGARNSLTAVTSGGNNNSIIGTIDANQTTTTISQTGGGGNQTTLNMTGDKAVVDITTVGATNITNITQSGGGAVGHVAVLNINGSGNNTTITQSGTIDTTVNIHSAGNGNTFTINTFN